ncbi:DUF2564 family protein, partial [Bacillus velezensis]
LQALDQDFLQKQRMLLDDCQHQLDEFEK